MKKAFLLFFFLPVFSFSQSDYKTNPTKPYFPEGIKIGTTSSEEDGAMRYNSGQLEIYNGFAWVDFGSVSVDSIRALYKGVAVTTMSPLSPTQGDWWRCGETGTYTNFGATVATAGDILSYTGSNWELVESGDLSAYYTGTETDYNILSSSSWAELLVKKALYPTAKWVDVSYGGATKNGGFDTPYITIATAYTAASDGDIIILKSGNYPNAALVTLGKELTLIGVGNPVITYNAATVSYVFNVTDNNVTLKDLTVDAIENDAQTGTYCLGFSGSVTGFTAENVIFKNADTKGFYHASTTGAITVTNCTFDNCKYPIDSYQGGTITGNTFLSTCVAGFAAITFGTNATLPAIVEDNLMQITNSLLVSHGGTGSVTIRNNIIDGRIASITATNSTVIINGNTAIQTLTNSTISITTAAEATTIQIDSNNIQYRLLNSPDGLNYKVISLIDQKSVEINNNIIDCLTKTALGTGDFDIIYMTNTDSLCNKFHVKNNLIKSRLQEGYIIGIGGESTSADNNLISGIVVENNEIYGDHYFDNYVSPVTHGIFIGHMINAKVQYNKLFGLSRGIIYKHTGGRSTDTLTGIFSNIVVNCNLGISVAGQELVRAYNNVVIYTDTNLVSNYAFYTEVVGASKTDSLHLKNNIVLFWGTNFGNPIYIRDGATHCTNLLSDYNCIWGQESFKFNAAGETSFAAWQALGNDTHSINVNPKMNFTYYSISSTSPCVGTGKNLGVGYDYGLHPLSSYSELILQQQTGTWDMGAVIDNN